MDYLEYICLALIIRTTYKYTSARVKWPDELNGTEFTHRRKYLKRKAKTCRLEGDTLYIQVAETEIRALQGPNGTIQSHLVQFLTRTLDDGFREVFVEKEGGPTRWDLISQYHDDEEGGAHIGKYSVTVTFNG